jgi:transcription-repair coupling factor (superfamily II helicase)
VEAIGFRRHNPPLSALPLPLSTSKYPLLLNPPLPQAAGAPLRWSGLPGQSAALAIAEAAAGHEGLLVVVAGNEQRAYRLEEELAFFLGGSLPLLHFPDTETLPYDPFSPHQEILSDRLAALYRLPAQRGGVLIVTAGTLLERLPPQAWLYGRVLLLKTGDHLDPRGFRERLVAAGYQSVSEVQTQGEFAVRGALIDVFPMGSHEAYRLDLFDEDVETIRRFDPETQRSTEKVAEVRLLPAREFPTDKEGIETFRRRYREYFPGDPSRSRIYAEVSKGLMPAGIEAYLPLFFASPIEGGSKSTSTLFDYLPAGCLMVETEDIAVAWAAEWKQIEERHQRYSGNLERPVMNPADLFLQPAQAQEEIAQYLRVAITAEAGDAADQKVEPLPAGADAMKAFLAQGNGRVLFVAESAGRREALLNWLKPLGLQSREHSGWLAFASDRNRYGVTLGPLQEGFRVGGRGAEPGTALIAESQVFGQHAPVSVRKRGRIRDPETILRDLNDLQPGAPVVHVEHGVGRYRGLQKLDAGGVAAEYLVLEYAEGDKLYVPVASLNQIHAGFRTLEQGA